MVNLGIPGLPTGNSTTYTHGIKRLYWIDKCEPSNCTMVKHLAKRVQISKLNMYNRITR